jgi:hypothetical protein
MRYRACGDEEEKMSTLTLNIVLKINLHGVVTFTVKEEETAAAMKIIMHNPNNGEHPLLWQLPDAARKLGAKDYVVICKDGSTDIRKFNYES